MRTLKEFYRVFAFDFVCVGHSLYYAAYNLNGIFVFDLDKKENRFLGSVPNEYVMSGNYYTGIDIIDDNLYIAPDETSSFVVYNLKTKEIRKIALPDTKIEYSVYSKFRSVICFAGKIYYIPIRFPGLVEMDKNENIVLHTYDILDKKEILITSECVFDNNIYMTMWNSQLNKMEKPLLFQPTTNQFQRLEMEEYKQIYHVCTDGEKLWLLTERGLVSWNIREDKMKCYELPQQLPESRRLIKCVFFDKKIWLFSGMGDLYTYFMTDQETFYNIVFFSDCIKDPEIANRFISVKVYGTKLFCFNASVGKLFVFSNGKCKDYKLKIPETYVENNYVSPELLQKDIIAEMEVLNVWGQCLELNDYINHISISDIKISSEERKNMGRRIFEKLRN